MVINKHSLFLLQICCITLPFLILASVGYALHSQWKGISPTISNQHVPVIPKDGEVQKIPTPVGMFKTHAWRHTSAIGTTNDPTIDGGIINAVDGLGVNQPPLKIATLSNVEKESGQSIHASSNNNPQSGKRFSDDWATSNRVKTILNDAIKTGKLDYVLAQSDARNMPASVALVPVVESSYKNNAVSNKGAAGSWQLMPETAKENGINPEERTQFVPATKAALNYLSQLHHQFGSWELAFAAYNAGSAAVKVAIQKNPEATTINELSLPQETKNYVSRLMKINKALISDEKNDTTRKTDKA